LLHQHHQVMNKISEGKDFYNGFHNSVALISH
jgi:hypothetical protein